MTNGISHLIDSKANPQRDTTLDKMSSLSGIQDVTNLRGGQRVVESIAPYDLFFFSIQHCSAACQSLFAIGQQLGHGHHCPKRLLYSELCDDLESVLVHGSTNT
jgi:hypothetical protein